MFCQALNNYYIFISKMIDEASPFSDINIFTVDRSISRTKQSLFQISKKNKITPLLTDCQNQNLEKPSKKMPVTFFQKSSEEIITSSQNQKMIPNNNIKLPKIPFNDIRLNLKLRRQKSILSENIFSRYQNFQQSAEILPAKRGSTQIIKQQNEEIKHEAKVPKLIMVRTKKMFIGMKSDRKKQSQSNSIITKQQKKPSIIKHTKISNFTFCDITPRLLSQIIRSYNNASIEQSTSNYKAFIGKGNNSKLVKRLLRMRGNWDILQSYQQGQINFLWTQKKCKKFYDKLPLKSVVCSNMKELAIVDNQNRFGKLKQQYPYIKCISNLLEQEYFNKYIKDLLQEVQLKPKAILGTKVHEFISDLYGQHIHHKNIIHNHISSAGQIGNKKGLFYHITRHYKSKNINPFLIIPPTVHISSILNTLTEDSLSELLPFSLPCILKPGQNTNRGQGITVHNSISTLLQQLIQSNRFEQGETHIVQQYIQPFLYYNRKFDIRVWVLWQGSQAWWYQEGYLRTASREFNIKNTSKYVHLTNDAVQKHCEYYGKFEPANKVSFQDFQKYLNTLNIKRNFFEEIYPKMKQIALNVFQAGSAVIDYDSKRTFTYQLFGLDFMIDENFKVWLLQVNTNPCLQTGCSLLTRLISNMVDNAMQICVDPWCPPAKQRPNINQNTFKFQLLFDSARAKSYIGNYISIEDESDQDKNMQTFVN